MRRPFRTTALAASLVLLAGCASAGGGSDEPSSTYSADMGRACYDNFREAFDRIIVNRHQYRLIRANEQYSTIQYETDWTSETPTPEEREQGINAARHRMVVEGRRLDGPYRWRMNAEYEVRSEMQTSWHPAPMPDGLREELRQIVRQMTLEYETGVRC